MISYPIKRLLVLCNKCFNQNERKFSFLSIVGKVFNNRNDNKVNSYNNWQSLQSLKYCTNSDANDSDIEQLLNENQLEDIYPRNWRTIDGKHGVLLVMPRQKWGPIRMDKTSAQLLTDETITLINTLPNMRVVDTLMISTLYITTKQLFGSGSLQLLKKMIGCNTSISAVVFAVDMLSSLQLSELEQHLGVEIYDRYSIVLKIFKERARTKESKLQIALAEIPYIRNNLGVLEKTGHSRQKSSLQKVGGLGETWIETRKRLLIDRETKLKKQLDKIKSNRELLRANRVRKQFPIIAVVGYTNCGKTSLIKALTNDEKLIPKDQLFATLDVTVHSGRLPSSMEVLYTDTIGFISHIPTTLIHSFKATLSEICLADVIVHVSDISHPNCELQEKTVYKTLDEIQVPDKLRSSMIEVSNKIDLVKDPNILESSDKLLISATKGIGLNQLMTRIEKCVLSNTGRLETTFRVPNGGYEYQWLYKESTIRECEVDPKDNNYLYLKLLITKEAFAKFKHNFGDQYIQ